MQDRNIERKEVLRFLIGGGSAVLTDYILYRVFLTAGWQLSIAKACSYAGGAAVGFVINKLWTFKSRKFSFTEIAKYIILYIFSALLNALVNHLVLAVLPVTIIGFLCATGISTVINFLGQKFFVFAKASGS